MGNKKRTTKESINSTKFEISLWNKVKLVVEKDGTKKAINAEYKDDPLFPVITVSGFNEKNGCEEEYSIPCYAILSDWSYSDWEEEYKETGDSPAYSFPTGVEDAIFCHVNDLRLRLNNLRENLKVEEENAKKLQEISAYYLLDENVVGKEELSGKAYFFKNTEWLPDEEGFLRNGSKKEITEDEAMQLITDQTVDFLMAKWIEKYAADKTMWDISPGWFSKCVSVYFEINGVRRVLDAKDFIFEDGPAKDGFIESIGKEIAADLRACGATVGEIYGLPD